VSGGGVNEPARLPGGSLRVTPIDAKTTYTLSCTGPGGTSTKTVDVELTERPTPPTTPNPLPIPTPPGQGRAPQVYLNALPSQIAAGASSRVNWVAIGATSCEASGAWDGTKSSIGSTQVTPAATATYTLTCTGPGGTATGAKTITVTP
jgi:hypothetical protein